MVFSVAQIIGPVVDVQCSSDEAPSVTVAQSYKAGNVTVEVQLLLGDRSYRTVAMSGTDGLRRGEVAELLNGPISVPVGSCTLGRIFNVLGEPVDGKGPVKSDLRRAIHRMPPAYIELDTSRAIFETGIKVSARWSMDVLHTNAAARLGSLVALEWARRCSSWS